MIIPACIIHLFLGPLIPVWSQIDFTFEPVWISADARCSTGGAVGDVDGDGLMDFAVSNGNDMVAEPEVLYFGVSDGFEEEPHWISSDQDFSGHCVLGDLNGDRMPEFIVANYIGSTQGFTETRSKIYFNSPTGLETAPSWLTADLDNTFRVVLGDVDGDGDLDLACANGEAYTSNPQPNEIYFNDCGVIDRYPGWISEDVDCSYDVKFEDFDRDGDLDLAFANSKSPTRLYLNFGNGLETTASWSAEESDNDNSLIWADIDGDLWVDLAVITNKQLQGSGKIKIFRNQSGALTTYPYWTIDVPDDGYGSALLAEDFDLDGDLDLAAGSWWGSVVIYENEGFGLASSPVWASSNMFVVEMLTSLKAPVGSLGVIRDVFSVSEFSRAIRIPSKPLEINVSVDGKPNVPADYCYDSGTGYLTFSRPPDPGSSIEICYPAYYVQYILAASWGDGNAQGANYGYANNVPTPTPTPQDPALDLKLNAETYTGGDRFLCYVDIHNPKESFEVDFYALLEVLDSFYFFPTWQEMPDYVGILLTGTDTLRVELFDFIMPEPIGFSGILNFYSAIFHPGTYDLICDFDFEQCFVSDGS